MAPGPASRKPRENQFPFDLGVRGRKTGLTVPDTGVRDEHGLEPIDHLFSSPEKAPKGRLSTRNTRKSANMNATLSSEEDMDMGESTAPEPTQVLTERKRAGVRMPPPRSKSPIKTFLQSPARRHPSVGPISSPTRGSVVTPGRVNLHTTVNRRLDFSIDDLDRNESTNLRASPQKKQAPGNAASAKLTNGTNLKPGFRSSSDVDLDQENSGQIQDESVNQEEADSYQIGQQDEEQDLDQQEEPEVEQTTVQPTKKRGRPPAAHVPMAQAAVPKRGRGRPRKSIEAPTEEEPDAEDPAEEEVDQRAAKRPRVASKSSEVKKPAPKKNAPKTKPPRLSSPPAIQRGPPRPKNNHGLYILRRELPDGSSHTRSGRNVIRPLAYWKNETVVYGEDEEADGDRSFMVPVIKEVVRADEVEQTKSRRGPHKKGSKTGKLKKAKQEPESDEEAEDISEPWESGPGRISCEVREWNSDDITGEFSEETEQEIALSAQAIITREVPGASFRFAKTLTQPFFGAGMIDVPPGGLKKPKNSRRMHMVFFVFSGRVSVVVNGNTFRIGKGGMWQVPRGNLYSIENDYDYPARIFFAQGNEQEFTIDLS